MELNEMEKKLLFQVEGDYQTKILNELYMTVRYSNNSEQREAAEGLMAKLRVLSNAECMDLVKDIQKNYRLPYPARTIGEKIAEARQQSGAEKLKGHDIMALERFDPEVKHMIVFDVLSYGAKIAGQNQKRYTDKNAAIKYLDGRKKAYSHLFTEISPPIPKEYEHHFMVHGTLLPGYTVEGLEQAKTEHAAAEVSEGGIFTPENQEKPSVLGKLSVAKTQEKTPTTPGTAMKKKEDIQL